MPRFKVTTYVEEVVYVDAETAEEAEEMAVMRSDVDEVMVSDREVVEF